MGSFSEEQIIAAIIGAVVGLIIGFLVGKRSAPGSEENRNLEKKLQEANSSREDFERRINAHFSDTASKLNALTQNYREVYEHLAKGATELASKDSSSRFEALAAPAGASAGNAIEADSVAVEPPRDYAPKTSPNDPGMLDENFGLDGEDLPPEDSSKRVDDGDSGKTGSSEKKGLIQLRFSPGPVRITARSGP